MIKNKKFLRIFCAALCLVMLLGMAACGRKEPDETVPAGQTAYGVEVRAESGAAMANVSVYVYADSTLEDLVQALKTDAEGKAAFTADTSDSYAVVLKELPAGFEAAASYALTGESTRIVLNSAVIADTDLTGVTYKLGDVIRDFTVTTPAGESHTLSKLLEENKAVVLNFWYTGCVPCQMEFPYLQEAYDKYSDELALLAINPVEADDVAIAEFQSAMGLTMPMAQGDPKFQDAFNNMSYPTTVVIDQYGQIVLVHKGMIDNAETFEAIFEYFTADEYEQKLFNGVGEFEVEPDPDPSVDPSEDPTDGTDESTEATEDSTESTEGTESTETTKPSTDTTKPSTDTTKPSTDTTKPNTNDGKEDENKPGEPIGKPLNNGEHFTFGGSLEYTLETIPAGYYAYCDFYKVSDTTLHIEAEDVYVIYEEVMYEPEDGHIYIPVHSDHTNVPISVIIGNTGSKDAVYAVNFYYAAGHMMNPIKLTVGKFTVNIPSGSQQGMFYTYTPTADGNLTLTINAVTVYEEAGISVTVSGSNSVPKQYEVQGGKGESLTIEVSKGDKVSINIYGVSESFDYEACKVTVTAEFE